MNQNIALFQLLRRKISSVPAENRAGEPDLTHRNRSGVSVVSSRQDFPEAPCASVELGSLRCSRLFPRCGTMAHTGLASASFAGVSRAKVLRKAGHHSSEVEVSINFLCEVGCDRQQ